MTDYADAWIKLATAATRLPESLPISPSDSGPMTTPSSVSTSEHDHECISDRIDLCIERWFCSCECGEMFATRHVSSSPTEPQEAAPRKHKSFELDDESYYEPEPPRCEGCGKCWQECPQSSAPPPSEQGTGPGARLVRLCARFDRLLSADPYSTYADKHEEYGAAFHDAVHALKDLRHFAAIIRQTWSGASSSSPSEQAIRETSTSEQLKEAILAYDAAAAKVYGEDTGYAEHRAARSRIASLFDAQTEEIARREEALEMFRDEQKRDKASLAVWWNCRRCRQ